MNVLEAIQTWSESLPIWQQDAIARLYEKRVLAVEDDEELYSILTAACGHRGGKAVQPRKPSFAVPSAQDGVKAAVQLVALKNLKNVNALADGCGLNIAPTGLTVIYGPNGAGKSGYARVLKKACRARDQRELVLPDGNRPPDQVGPAHAEFDVLIDGKPETLVWNDGKAPPAALAAISIFDARCAHAYIDNQGDFAYAPSGLDILEGLAKCCDRLKTKLDVDVAKHAVDLSIFHEIAKRGSTAAGKLMSSLSSKTATDEIERLATFDDKQKQRHAELAAIIASPSPKQQATALRQKSGRIDQVAQRIRKVTAILAEEKVTALRDLIDASREATKVATVAANMFKEGSNSLPGTGGDAWQNLFKAARAYAIESHPTNTFPVLDVGSRCPLCQQELDEAAVARLKAFDGYIEQEAEKLARLARENAKASFVVLRDADVAIVVDEPLAAELTELSPDMVASIEKFSQSLVTRKAAILVACNPGGDWTRVEAMAGDPSQTIDDISKELVRRAKELELVADDTSRKAIDGEYDELEARRLLHGVKTLVVTAVKNMAIGEKLKACEQEVTTTKISRKSTDLTETIASEELMKALNQEFAAARVDKLRVSMKAQSGKGKATYKLVLGFLAAMPPKDVLSEGEQRAMAIASFLAEVTLAGHSGGIVFDDPISSLDHIHREAVAKRIALESMKRQVIVFTHDLAFLNVLMYEARQVKIEPACRSLRRTKAGFGIAEETLPFEGASTKDRIGKLKVQQVECHRLHKAGDDEAYQNLGRSLYDRLRMTWERAVEHELLNGVVLRFRKGVETNKLKKVMVEQADIETVERNMAKCSNYTGHDGALDAVPTLPLPAELLEDINALDTWREAIERRKNSK
jgi:energy-coupling factor transporter ATP-binding protein EcfA2